MEERHCGEKDRCPNVLTAFRVFLYQNPDVRASNKLKRITEYVDTKEYTVLLDPGTSSSIISRKCVETQKIKINKNYSGNWSTPAGGIKTNEKVSIKFALVEFSASKKIFWDFHVTRPFHNLGYDMIIGRDLLDDLGFIIDFSTRSLVWDGLRIPMGTDKET